MFIINAGYIISYTSLSRYLTEFAALLNVRVFHCLAIQTVKSTGVGHKGCPHLLLHTPSTPPVQQHQLTLTPQATLRLTGGVPGKVGLHQTTYVCSVFFLLPFSYNCCTTVCNRGRYMAIYVITKGCRIKCKTVFYLFLYSISKLYL